MSFNLALIADIHGNAVALDAVSTDIKLENVDDVLCLGDVVAFGPEPKRSLDILRSLDCDVVIGNTDEWVINPPPLKAAKGKFRIRAQQLVWCADQLTAEDVDYLRSFKPTVKTDLGHGRTLLGFHGSPKSSSDVIMSTTAVSEFQEMMSDLDADIFAGGHTHLSMLRRHRDSLVINPGSVGLPVDRLALEDSEQLLLPYAEYAIVRSEEETLSVEFRQVKLDIEAILESVRESDFPHKERWMEGWEKLLKREEGA